MRKVTTMLVAMLLAFSARAEYLRTVGTGKDFESAKNNAIVTAIEIYIGTVVVSEREVHNKKLLKDEILLYSSGYVNDYKIISQSQNDNHVQVVLDVSVNTNRISNRILGRVTDPQHIDGNKLRPKVYCHQYAEDLSLDIVSYY